MTTRDELLEELYAHVSIAWIQNPPQGDLVKLILTRKEHSTIATLCQQLQQLDNSHVPENDFQKLSA